MNVSHLTDKYFTKSRNIVKMFGETIATYRIFMRRPSMMAYKFSRKHLLPFVFDGISNIKFHGRIGDIIPAKKPIITFSAPLSRVLELETVLLQGLTLAPIVAYNTYHMCISLPKVKFIDMHARHVCGAEMMDHVAYGVSVGSDRAKK